MITFWDALQVYRAQSERNKKLRQISGKDRQAIEALQNRQPKHCRFCCSPLSGRKTSWCGDSCIEAYLIACGDHEACKKAVRARDSEVCCLCGINLVTFRAEFLQYKAEDFDRKAWRMQRFLPKKYQQDPPFSIGFFGEFMVWVHTHDLWEIDHKIPVSKGGGCTGDISNLQTLCLACHKAKTKEDLKHG